VAGPLDIPRGKHRAPASGVHLFRVMRRSGRVLCWLAMRELVRPGNPSRALQSPRKRRRRPGARLSASIACATAVGLIALTGCGSSKPAYCTDRTNLENSIKGVSSLSFSSGLSGLQAQLTKIESDATTLVSSAKSDFPTETSAITSSVNALKSAVTALPSSPSPGQIATIVGDAANVVSSVTSFVNASKSKCS
jgi:hypothetical protein